ncbi:MAG: hypothetical protein PUD35_07355 [Bacteroidales bacterium]|nr:hypothetical protein [Bacteroidales bacterium]
MKHVDRIKDALRVGGVVSSESTLTMKSDDVLLRRIERLRELLHDDNKSIHLTFITSKGLKHNMYSGIVQNEVTLDDLF